MSDSYQQLPWIPVRRALRRRQLLEFSLVLTAVEIEHRIEPDADDWCLRVPDQAAPQALAEIERYLLENQPAGASPVQLFRFDSGWAGVAGFLLVIWALPWLELQLPELNWRGAGSLDAGLVQAGAWWRTVTALTLHADLGHIVANSLFGSVFGLFLGRYLGSGFGWLLVLLAGALGNGLNAWLQVDDFRAIGASTATFAALALTSAYVWRRGYFRGRGWRRSLAPVFAGIALLAFTGTGGENTDVVGHFAGFAAGGLLGVAAAGFDIRRLGRSGQWLAGGMALGLVAICWRLALGGA